MGGCILTLYVLCMYVSSIITYMYDCMYVWRVGVGRVSGLPRGAAGAARPVPQAGGGGSEDTAGGELRSALDSTNARPASAG